MSTKIHHGLRLVGGVDVFEATAKLREVMNPVRDLLDARLLVTGAVDILDDTALKGETLDHRPLWLAYEEYEADQKKHKPTERGHDPNRFSMAFGRDESTGRILALHYFEQPEYREALEAAGLFEDYAYWNNTDRPDHLTEEQWAERAETWARLLGLEAPARRMLTFDLRNDDAGDMFMLAVGHDRPEVVTRALEEYTPRRRAKRIAMDRCFSAALEGVEDPVSRLMSTYYEVSKVIDPVIETVEKLLPMIELDQLYAAQPVITPVSDESIDEAAAAAVAPLVNRVR